MLNDAFSAYWDVLTARPTAPVEPLSFVQTVFSKDSLLGAAIVGAGAWLGKKGIEALTDSWRQEKREREAMVWVMTETASRISSVEEHFPKAALPTLIERLSRTSRKKPFRFYLVSSYDTRSYEAFRQTAYRYGPRVIAAFHRYVTLDQFWVAQYEKLGSDDFADLPFERKKLAVTSLFQTTEELVAAGKDFLYQLSLDRRAASRGAGMVPFDKEAAEARNALKSLSRIIDDRACSKLKQKLEAIDNELKPLLHPFEHSDKREYGASHGDAPVQTRSDER
ncbi:hypothetical protein SAMN06297251_11154 [Fulvimarina manganoxydans]|uniref:Uncharacterized protein n=1 Tax=Fulvimarina manganoxydans TaxID=937218 RepID=A0A1W2CT30_9HYPH|nr:hypothetical protein [Fulvimarina manganoxydans]SMC87818.1 hypothetical protein SAMN06297251_11154 [Fulvimarina manganoxydans]